MVKGNSFLNEMIFLDLLCDNSNVSYLVKIGDTFMERHRDKKLTAPKLALIFCSPKISAQNVVVSRIRPLAGGSKYFVSPPA
jgi:hypothetical protein